MSYTSPYIEEHPNPDVQVDRGKVTGAVVTLWIFGVLGILMGFLLAFKPALLFEGKPQLLQMGSGFFLVLGLIGIAWGVAYLIMAVQISGRSSLGAAKGAYVLCLVELVLAAFSFNLISIGLNALKLWLVKRGYDALKGISLRVDQGNPENAMTAYYHAFIPLLVHVMKADEEIHPAEVEEMKRQCNLMNLSGWERDRIFENARDNPPPIPELVDRYLIAAEKIEMAWPKDKLLVSLGAIAGADRVLKESERRIIRKIGIAMNVDEAVLQSKLAFAEKEMLAKSLEEAVALFHLPQGATREQMDARYQELLQKNDPVDFAHLGTEVAARAERNRRNIERSYKVLTEAGS